MPSFKRSLMFVRSPTPLESASQHIDSKVFNQPLAYHPGVSTWSVANNVGTEGRIYADGQQIAFRNGPTYMEGQNWLGTERMRTDYLGHAATTEKSLSFGDGFVQTVFDSGSDVDNKQFAGQDYDAESSTLHADFRQYSSTQGRWMSPDPYDGSYDLGNPQSFNRYAYSLNNPLSMIDPSGLDEAPPDPGGSGAGGDGAVPTAVREIGLPLGLLERLLSMLGNLLNGPGSPSDGSGLFGGGTSTASGSPLTLGYQNIARPANQYASPLLGIGLEVPASSNVADDPGHTFIYFKDPTGNIVAMLSFGPGKPIGPAK